MKTKKRHSGGLRQEDIELLESLEGVRKSLDFAHRVFDSTVDNSLLDSLSYEIMSLNKRYEYYHRRCKERHLVAIMPGVL